MLSKVGSKRSQAESSWKRFLSTPVLSIGPDLSRGTDDGTRTRGGEGKAWEGRGGKKRKGREEARREAGKKEWKRSLFPPRIGYEGEVMSRCQNGRGRQAKEDELGDERGKEAMHLSRPGLELVVVQ